MSVIRIADAAYNLYSDQYVVTADVFPSPISGEENFTVLISVPKSRTYTEVDFKTYIEQEIKNQQNASPDYKGLSWKSDRV